MSLINFFNDKKIRKQKTSPSEIKDLFAISTRDFKDVKKARDILSVDWQFNLLYNSALKLCTVLLRSEGYRAGPVGHHKNIIECLPFILGVDKKKYQKYLDSCRVKRNRAAY